MKIYRIAQNMQNMAEDESVVYHGGRDIGKPLELQREHQGKDKSGTDAGGIFFTPSETYAKQYMKHPQGLYRYKIPSNEIIFDIRNQEHIDRFIDGSANWEGYDSPEGAERDAYKMIDSMIASARHGAIDWATGSQYIEEMEKAGFTGARFLERPAENIRELADGSFDLSGKPVYSFVLFRDKVKVERT